MKKTFIIAEAGVNHNGSLTQAKLLVDVAVESGADAVKFQSFNADQIVSINAPKAEYQKRVSRDESETQYNMLKSLQLSEQEQVELFSYCKDRQITFLSSPFDLQSADFLCKKLDLAQIKIASGEITNLPLLLKIAKLEKSVILSTGMSSLADIEKALAILAFGYLNPDNDTFPNDKSCENSYYSEDGQNILQNKVSLLHCTSDYPATFTDVNLNVLTTFKYAFGLKVGYSDHTLGTAISIAAIACGAEIIEKHFTLDKSLPGPDHQASLEPSELKNMITSIRQVEAALGVSRKIPTYNELKIRAVARKSLVATTTISAGEKFTEANIGCKRPGNGISPANFWKMLETCSDRNYSKDDLIEA